MTTYTKFSLAAKIRLHEKFTSEIFYWRKYPDLRYYRISVRISQCLVGVAVNDRPKVGVVDPKWAWSVNFRAR